MALSRDDLRFFALLLAVGFAGSWAYMLIHG